MMRPRISRRMLCVLIAVALLLTGAGVLFSHGEWLFALEQAWKRYPEPSLIRLIETGETRHWTLAELETTAGVRISNDLLLVNDSHPLPTDYVPTLEEYNGARMYPQMIAPYVALRDAVQARTNVRIYVSSDYRTPQEQQELLETGEAGVVAQVGCSEHEAGLALDVYAPYYAGENFLESRAGRMVNRVCSEYGFVIRYPKEKEAITGISYEPWHLRYVGLPHAAIMSESGLALEEYVDLLEVGEWYRHGEYLISRRSADALDLITGWSSCEISPDNTGYYIVTLKMS